MLCQGGHHAYTPFVLAPDQSEYPGWSRDGIALWRDLWLSVFACAAGDDIDRLRPPGQTRAARSGWYGLRDPVRRLLRWGVWVDCGSFLRAIPGLHQRADHESGHAALVHAPHRCHEVRAGDAWLHDTCDDCGNTLCLRAD